ncbi:hypothetical protein G7Z17_g2121 [Cylindrodendrum hubeiense]|uniref:Uncharacterized protein n=1 Tax=Cylindrodendrum hubeiense TaxID=595255 RepID=A0A9P5HDH7_9HYPO|nr:hypothetical protein G7Z17_g2121 [Cylindrodendrum hubeiense]
MDTVELKPAVCEDETNYLGHGDTNAGSQGNLADRYYLVEPMDNGISDMRPGDAALESIREDLKEIKYYYSIPWIDGCVTTVNRQDLKKPASGSNNGGVGGYIDAGCLRYSFVGGI